MTRNKRIILILAFGNFCSAGCAPGIKGKIPQVNENFATVFIARKAGGIGCSNAFLIKLNDEDFIRIACGMITQFKVPAGKKLKYPAFLRHCQMIVISNLLVGEILF